MNIAISEPTILDKLTDLAPYPVEFRQLMCYTGWFRFATDDSIVYRDTNFIPTIGINPTQSNPIQICSLVHEIGHALHYRRKCKCYVQNNDYLKELHATRFELRFLLRYKLKDALEYAIGTYIEKQHSSKTYEHVSEQIKTEKIWQKALDFVKG